MEYDVIVVGAGSAGAVLAARLTEDPGRSVLLLEAGPDYPDLGKLPQDLADGLSASTDKHDWHWMGNAVEGRAVTYPRGKVTGGSSAVNGIVAIRGTPEDYDEWASLGNEEWSWSAASPSFASWRTTRTMAATTTARAAPFLSSAGGRESLGNSRRRFRPPAARPATRIRTTTTCPDQPVSARGR